jgi:hypothetical protein
VLLANAGTTAELSAIDGKGMDFKSDPSSRLTGCVRQNATPVDFTANAQRHGACHIDQRQRDQKMLRRTDRGGTFLFVGIFVGTFPVSALST